MASIREIARYYLDDARDGIQWIAVWKTGRAWHAKNFCPADISRNGFPTWEEEDLESLREIADADPHAVILNGYYHNLGDPDEMTAETLAKFLRWQYEDNNGYVVSDYLPETAEETDPAQEEAEEPKTAETNQPTKYTETRVLTMDKLRSLCIKHDWYTYGTSEEYAALLDRLYNAMGFPEHMTTEKLAEIAADIMAHSEITDCTITSVMFELARACCTYFDVA